MSNFEEDDEDLAFTPAPSGWRACFIGDPDPYEAPLVGWVTRRSVEYREIRVVGVTHHWENYGEVPLTPIYEKDSTFLCYLAPGEEIDEELRKESRRRVAERAAKR